LIVRAADGVNTRRLDHDRPEVNEQVLYARMIDVEETTLIT
jgi:hypothetical protein